VTKSHVEILAASCRSSQRRALIGSRYATAAMVATDDHILYALDIDGVLQHRKTAPLAHFRTRKSKPGPLSNCRHCSATTHLRASRHASLLQVLVHIHDLF
jgi:hypothetical protein